MSGTSADETSGPSTSCAAARALAVLGAFAMMLTLLLGATPAQAADAPGTAPVEYRVGGGAWSTTPPALFDSGWRPVPGGSAQSVLEIRSHRPGQTIVAVYLASATAAPAHLAEAASLRVGELATAFSAETAGAGAATDCRLVQPQRVLAEGETLRVPVSLGIGSGLEGGQLGELAFELQLQLSDTGPVTLANGCPVDPVIVHAFSGAGQVADASDGRALSSTGDLLPQWLLPAAVIAVWIGAAGALEIGRRRRRRSRR